jgi:hypothetical protein
VSKCLTFWARVNGKCYHNPFQQGVSEEIIPAYQQGKNVISNGGNVKRCLKNMAGYKVGYRHVHKIKTTTKPFSPEQAGMGS